MNEDMGKYEKKQAKHKKKYVNKISEKNLSGKVLNTNGIIEFQIYKDSKCDIHSIYIPPAYYTEKLYHVNRKTCLFVVCGQIYVTVNEKKTLLGSGEHIEIMPLEIFTIISLQENTYIIEIGNSCKYNSTCLVEKEGKKYEIIINSSYFKHTGDKTIKKIDRYNLVITHENIRSKKLLSYIKVYNSKLYINVLKY